MDDGGVHVVRDFDSNPQMVSVSRLPGTPLAYTRGDGMLGGLLVVSQLAVTRVRTNSVPESLEVLMARHARLPGAMLDVSYESLAEKPEMVLRVVFSFLGLRYEKGVLEGQTLHRQRVGHARRYEMFVPELVALRRAAST